MRIASSILIAIAASAGVASSTPAPKPVGFDKTGKAACVAIPALPASASDAQRTASRLANSVRRLACEPALWSKPGRDVTTELGLVTGESLYFRSPTGMNLELAKPTTVRALLGAMGGSRGYLRLRMNAYHQQWSLVTSATSTLDTFDRFGPGLIYISVDYKSDVERASGTIVPVTGDPAISFIGISMPTLVVASDPAAIKDLGTALRALAAKPAMLADQPPAVAKVVGLTDERFKVDRTAIYGTTRVDGISILPLRTKIDAAALVKELGLLDASALQVNAEHNIWNLQSSGKTEIRWHGVTIQIELANAHGASLDGVTVSFISVFP